MKKGFLVYSQDMRGHYVIGKVFLNKEKADAYAKELEDIGFTKPMGVDSRFIEFAEVVEIEIDEE